MTIQTKISFILLSIILTGCPSQTGPSPTPPSPGPQPDTDLVADMCAHLQEMGCEEGGDVYNDNLPGELDVPNQSCTDFHKGLQENGVFVNPKCVLRAPSCSVIEDYRAQDADDC